MFGLTLKENSMPKGLSVSRALPDSRGSGIHLHPCRPAAKKQKQKTQTHTQATRQGAAKERFLCLLQTFRTSRGRSISRCREKKSRTVTPPSTPEEPNPGHYWTRDGEALQPLKVGETRVRVGIMPSMPSILFLPLLLRQLLQQLLLL